VSEVGDTQRCYIIQLQVYPWHTRDNNLDIPKIPAPNAPSNYLTSFVNIQIVQIFKKPHNMQIISELEKREKDDLLISQEEKMKKNLRAVAKKKNIQRM